MSFVCQVCEKVFATKQALKRHTNSVHEHIKYVCYCKKEFARKCDLARHKRTIHQAVDQFECETCSRKFNQKSNLVRHLNICGKKRTGAESLNTQDPKRTKLDPAVNQNTSEQPRKRKWKDLELLADEVILEQDPDMKTILQENWSSIRSFVRKGRVQNLFNFYYKKSFPELIPTIVETIMENQTERFKLNFSFGFILRNILDDTLR